MPNSYRINQRLLDSPLLFFLIINKYINIPSTLDIIHAHAKNIGPMVPVKENERITLVNKHIVDMIAR